MALMLRCLPRIALGCILGFIASGASAVDLSVGAAAVDITPPVPYRMEGYFSERLSTGTHDPLWAKALVLRQGAEQIALVFCDLAMVPAAVTTPARRLAEKQTGIPADRILIAATHSHTGPLYASSLREYLHQQAVAKHGSDPYEKVDYPAELARKLAQAVADAHKALQPAKLEAGLARQQGLSFNRRFHMKDGSVRFNPGKLNPAIVRPAGPIDPDVGILLARSAGDRQPLALLTVFALHLDTVGGTLYSADYPYYLERSLRQSLEQGLVSLFRQRHVRRHQPFRRENPRHAQNPVYRRNVGGHREGQACRTEVPRPAAVGGAESSGSSAAAPLHGGRNRLG